MKKVFILILFFAAIHSFTLDNESIDLENYKIIETDFKIKEVKIKIAYKLKENRRESISEKDKKFSVVEKLLILSADNSKVFLNVDYDNIYADNKRIIDFSLEKYKVLDFYGWSVAIFEHASKLDNLPIVRVDPILQGGKGITDGFTLYFHDDYNQYVYEVLGIQGIPAIYTNLDEPDFIAVARSGIKQNELDYLDEYFFNYLDALTKEDLRLFRNTLFALYGYDFKSKDLKDYFSKYDWYKPDKSITNDLSILSEPQQLLFNLILKKEKE